MRPGLSIALALLLFASGCTLLQSAPLSTTSPTPQISPSPPPLTSPPAAVAPTLLPSNTPAPLLANTPSSTPVPPLPGTPPPLLQYSPWEQVMAVAWSPDGELLAVSAGELIHLYNAGTYEELWTLNTGAWTPVLAFSPDGRWLASGSQDGAARLWDPGLGMLVKSMDGHPKGINCLAFSPDGLLLATAGNDAIVRLWELASGEVVAKIVGGVFAVPGLSFDRTGSLLATTDGRNLRLRDVATQRLVNTLRFATRAEDPSFYSLAFSPDGRILATGDTGNGIQLWDAESGELLDTLSGHAGNPERASGLVWRVAFNPDGRLLASAGGDATARLWEVDTGELLQTFSGHHLAVTGVAFSRDGAWLASGSLDGTVRLWEIQE